MASRHTPRIADWRIADGVRVEELDGTWLALDPTGGVVYRLEALAAEAVRHVAHRMPLPARLVPAARELAGHGVLEHPSRRAVLRAAGAGSLGVATLMLPGASAAASPGEPLTPATLSGQFDGPTGLDIDGAGVLYVGDQTNSLIRRVSTLGSISTLAGTRQDSFNPLSEDGTAAAAKFANPTGVALDGQALRVIEFWSARVRSVDVTTGQVTTLAGSSPGTPIEGTGAEARFSASYDLAVLDGTVYVADYTNARIRAVTSDGVVTTLAGSSPAAAVDANGTLARFNDPFGICAEGGDLFVADRGNRRIRRVTSAGVVTTLAGGAISGPAEDGTGADAVFSPSLRGIVGDGAGTLYVTDGNAVRRIVISTGVVTTIAGAADESEGFVNATGTAARFALPWGLAHRAGVLYVADRLNHVIRRIDLSTFAVTTFAGTTSGSADSTG